MDVTFSTTFAKSLRVTQRQPALGLQLELQIGDLTRLTDGQNVFCGFALRLRRLMWRSLKSRYHWILPAQCRQPLIRSLLD